MQPRPFLHERLPELARELEQNLNAEGENFLAGSIQTLRIHSACECSDITCGSFYTGPRPDGAFGPGHRNILLDPTKGMMILDVVDDVIRYVELIDRPDIQEALHSSSNLATKPFCCSISMASSAPSAAAFHQVSYARQSEATRSSGPSSTETGCSSSARSSNSSGPRPGNTQRTIRCLRSSSLDNSP